MPLRCYGNEEDKSGGFGSSGSGGVGGRGESDWKDIDDAPLGHSGAAHMAETEVTQGKGNVRPEAALGTSYGLLLNELEHAPSAAMAPLMTIFKAALELKNTSVYSPDAQFILFLVESAVHVEAYLTHAAFQPPPLKSQGASSGAGLGSGHSSSNSSGGAKTLHAHMRRTTELRALRLDLRALMLGPMAAVLDRWADEAGAVSSGNESDGSATGGVSGTAGTGVGSAGGSVAGVGGASAAPSGDLPTLCVVHAYRALLYSNSTLEELGYFADPIKWTAKWATSAATTTSSTGAGAAGAGSSMSVDDGSGVAPCSGEETIFARLLGGAAFVQNWHGFGLGQQRSDLLRCLGGDARDNEQRLLRFLQVGGVE